MSMKETFDDLPPILKNNNYSIPKCIKQYRDDNIMIRFEWRKRFPTGSWVLYTWEEDDQKWKQWNAYHIDHLNALEVFSHYDLAEGHVVCAGLGFGVREEWILTKPEVTKLTVIEKNSHLIEYHKKHYTNDKIEYVHCDFSDYKGSCDTLLVDTWEQANYGMIKNHEKIFKSLENISCNKFWYWPLETSYNYKGYKSLLSLFDNLAVLSEEKYNYYRRIHRNRLNKMAIDG